MRVVVVVLPFEPVMATIVALEKAAGQFQLADDGEAELLSLFDFGGIEWHAGGDDDQILAAEGQEAMAAGLNHDAGFRGVRGSGRCKGGGTARIADCHAGSAVA